ncbi:hypothetical protein NQ314_009892 [Rhamnusium bicolor]|uniref:Uncharacterized protein n=1 Tax=Rhamnusium bicolor TaxID=1586634 RepID=A0AAV8XUX1_9CUCU|nr:hypothetical protein NQ314_009892 [Rhamnusium bicolor]
MDARTMGTLKEERLKLEEGMEKLKTELENSLKTEEEKLKVHFETRKEELEKYYEEKLAEIEKELAERSQMTELRNKMQNELEHDKNKSVCDERMYEKLRCEKRLLEDKYRCLKDKYLRLKTDVKISIEKRNKKERTEYSNKYNWFGNGTKQFK